MNKIGIIGKGFVGTAVAQGFSPHSGYESEVKIFDKDRSEERRVGKECER